METELGNRENQGREHITYSSTVSEASQVKVFLKGREFVACWYVVMVRLGDGKCG